MTAGARDSLDRLRARIAAIERDIDVGSYRPGPWAGVVRAVRNAPDAQRGALAEEISRVSRKLHLRSGRNTISPAAGIAIELAAVVIGGSLLAFALGAGSNVASIAAMASWAIAFQPLVKVAAGTALGVGYDYAYLYGIEPRFKMRFGSYLAAPRWKRILLHLSGMAGTPLGVMLVAMAARAKLPVSAMICWAAFWLAVAINVVSLVVATLGVRRLGPFRVDESSGGAVGIELREALGL
jgi:hypothetical protein